MSMDIDEFWDKVFVAATRAGRTSIAAKLLADNAVSIRKQRQRPGDDADEWKDRVDAVLEYHKQHRSGPGGGLH